MLKCQKIVGISRSKSWPSLIWRNSSFSPFLLQHEVEFPLPHSEHWDHIQPPASSWQPPHWGTCHSPQCLLQPHLQFWGLWSCWTLRGEEDSHCSGLWDLVSLPDRPLSMYHIFPEKKKLLWFIHLVEGCWTVDLICQGNFLAVFFKCAGPLTF